MCRSENTISMAKFYENEEHCQPQRSRKYLTHGFHGS